MISLGVMSTQNHRRLITKYHQIREAASCSISRQPAKLHFTHCNKNPTDNHPSYEFLASFSSPVEWE